MCNYAKFEMCQYKKSGTRYFKCQQILEYISKDPYMQDSLYLPELKLKLSKTSPKTATICTGNGSFLSLLPCFV